MRCHKGSHMRGYRRLKDTQTKIEPPRVHGLMKLRCSLGKLDGKRFISQRVRIGHGDFPVAQRRKVGRIKFLPDRTRPAEGVPIGVATRGLIQKGMAEEQKAGIGPDLFRKDMQAVNRAGPQLRHGVG